MPDRHPLVQSRTDWVRLFHLAGVSGTGRHALLFAQTLFLPALRCWWPTSALLLLSLVSSPHTTVLSFFQGLHIPYFSARWTFLLPFLSTKPPSVVHSLF